MPADDVRERLRTAALEIIGARGIDGLTLRRLADRSGLTLDEVRAHHATAQDCLYELYGWIVGDWLLELAAACAAAEEWQRGFAIWQRDLLRRLSQRPAEARLCVFEARAADRELRRHREVARRWLIDLLATAHRAQHPDDGDARLRIEVMVGAGFRLISTFIEDHGARRLPELEPALAEVRDRLSPAGA